MKRSVARLRAVAVAGLLGGLALGLGEAKAVVITSGCANVDVSCTLDELFGGASITVNSKRFSGWALEQDFSSVLVDFTLIDVVGLDDGGLEPGPGLSFVATGGALAVGAGDSIDFSLNFGVQDTGGFIVDNSLELVEFIVTDLAFIEISEAVFDPGGVNLANKFVTSDPFFGDTFDEAAFDQQTALIIEKDILVDAFFGGDAELLVFEQRFSQIPEPGTLALFGIGLAGLGWLAQRRRLRAAPRAQT